MHSAEQRSDLGQTKARLLGESDQMQTVHGVRRVPTLAEGATSRRQQAHPFVVAQRGGPHADLGGHLADGEFR